MKKKFQMILLVLVIVFSGSCGNSEEKDKTQEELVLRYALFCPSGRNACFSSCDAACLSQPTQTQQTSCMIDCSNNCSLNCDAVFFYWFSQMQ